MAMLDDMQDKMGGNMDELRDRYEELKSREQNNTLDDQGRQELDRLRDRFERKD